MWWSGHWINVLHDPSRPPIPRTLATERRQGTYNPPAHTPITAAHLGLG